MHVFVYGEARGQLQIILQAHSPLTQNLLLACNLAVKWGYRLQSLQLELQAGAEHLALSYWFGGIMLSTLLDSLSLQLFVFFKCWGSQG